MEGCLSHRDSDPTWSKARDDAHEYKECLGGKPYRLCLCKRLRAADRRDETIAIVCASNPSVAAAPCHFSLRLGHGAALIYHRHIIHYRAATSLPLTQGRLWVGAMPKAG